MRGRNWQHSVAGGSEVWAPGGQVVLFDLSDRMLAVAREKAATAGLEERLEFLTEDMLHLPFPDASFDSVLSTYSLCPLYDPSGGGVRTVSRSQTWWSDRHSSLRRAAEYPGPLVRGTDRKRRVAFSLALAWLPSGFRASNPGARGAKVIWSRLVGVPLWPFLVLMLEKPAA